MASLKTVTRADPFWKVLKDQCDKTLFDYATIPGQTANEGYEVFKAKLNEAVTKALAHTKPLKPPRSSENASTSCFVQ